MDQQQIHIQIHCRDYRKTYLHYHDQNPSGKFGKNLIYILVYDNGPILLISQIHRTPEANFSYFPIIFSAFVPNKKIWSYCLVLARHIDSIDLIIKSIDRELVPLQTEKITYSGYYGSNKIKNDLFLSF